MESQEHKNIVLALINWFKEKGYTITCADYEDYKKCTELESHIPDVMVTDSTGLTHIAEAEICESLEYEQTVEQFKEFSKRVMKNDNRTCPFYVGIPSNCKAKLDDLIAREKLSNVNPLYINNN